MPTVECRASVPGGRRVPVIEHDIRVAQPEQDVSALPACLPTYVLLIHLDIIQMRMKSLEVFRKQYELWILLL